jgi:hypothetical protein
MSYYCKGATFTSVKVPVIYTTDAVADQMSMEIAVPDATTDEFEIELQEESPCE